MSNLTNHDPKTLSVFEIIAAYFTDTYLNNLHYTAKLNLTGGTSFTDEFVRYVKTYVVGVKNDADCYHQVVRGLHTYFTATTVCATIGFSDFVDRVVGVCVPDEYFQKMSSDVRDGLLENIVCCVAADTAAFVTQPDMLRRIIDRAISTPAVTCRMVQDAAINSLITKRSEIHNRFLKIQCQSRDTVSMDIVVGMKKALRKLVTEKSEALSNVSALEDEIAALNSELSNCKVRMAKLLKLVTMMRDGHQRGASEVGASMLVPKENNIAEEMPSAIVPLGTKHLTQRENIAEPDIDEYTGNREVPTEDRIAETGMDEYTGNGEVPSEDHVAEVDAMVLFRGEVPTEDHVDEGNMGIFNTNNAEDTSVYDEQPAMLASLMGDIDNY